MKLIYKNFIDRIDRCAEKKTNYKRTIRKNRKLRNVLTLTKQNSCYLWKRTKIKTCRTLHQHKIDF